MFPISPRRGQQAAPGSPQPAPNDPVQQQQGEGPSNLLQRATPITSRSRQPSSDRAQRPRQQQLRWVPRAQLPAVQEDPRRALADVVTQDVEQWRRAALPRATQFQGGLNLWQNGEDGRPAKVAEVADQIRDAFRTRATALRIEGLPADDLPDSLGHLSDLTQLTLFALHCKRLPDSIGHLSNLRTLEVVQNADLTRLPESTAQLENLEVLRVSAKLKALPAQISALSNLHTLALSFGTYAKLPPGFTRLRALQHLEITHSKPATPGQPGGLQELPHDFGRLQALQTLKLSDHARLAAIPPSLYDLSALQDLTISGCPALTTLQPGIERLRQLTTLNLSYNRGLTTLPAGVGQLPALRKLDLHDSTGLTILPDLSGLASVTEIDLRNCSGLQALPTGLQGLRHLRKLDLTGCRQLPIDAIHALVATLPRRCTVVMPNRQERRGGTPVPQPLPAMPRWEPAPGQEAPARIRNAQPRAENQTRLQAWKAQLQPLSRHDTNNRFAQWLEAIAQQRLNESDLRKMNRVMDALEASPGFRAKAFALASEQVILERDNMGMTMVGVAPRTFSTVRDMHSLMLESRLSDPNGFDAGPSGRPGSARQYITDFLREQYQHLVRTGHPDPVGRLVGDDPGQPRPFGRRQEAWGPLAAYVRTHDPVGRQIARSVAATRERLEEYASGPSGDAAGASTSSQPPADSAELDEQTYLQMTESVLKASELALHERCKEVAKELLRLNEAPRR